MIPSKTLNIYKISREMELARAQGIYCNIPKEVTKKLLDSEKSKQTYFIVSKL